jgi:hypothetical protein
MLLDEVLGSNINECVHQFISYKCNVQTCVSWWMSQPHFGAKCENATHTPKSGKMESSETPENSELDLRG